MLARYGTLLVFVGLIYLSAARKRTVVAFKSTEDFFNLYKEFMNWFQARKSCESKGQKLVSLNTTEKWIIIRNYLNKTKDIEPYWTSGSDFLSFGRHAWLPSGIEIPSNYWFTDQPDNLHGIEHCDEFNIQGSRLMNDQVCTRDRYYICERLCN